jgi:hypothetical protein
MTADHFEPLFSCPSSVRVNRRLEGEIEFLRPGNTLVRLAIGYTAHHVTSIVGSGDRQEADDRESRDSRAPPAISGERHARFPGKPEFGLHA